MDKALAIDLSTSLVSYREFYELTEQLRRNYQRKARTGKYDPVLAAKGYETFIRRAIRSDWFKRLYADLGKVDAETIRETARLIEEHYNEWVFVS